MHARLGSPPLHDLVYLCRTKAVTLINFGLSKHLVRENLLLTDQRGSLAYVSPDVLSGESGNECHMISM